MLTFISAIDSFSQSVAKAFAWCIVVLALSQGFDIAARSLFDGPTRWALDLSYIMYGTLFMMGGAYVLSRDAHARADVLFRKWRPRTQGIVELALYLLLFYPAVLALIVGGWQFASQSIGHREVSVMSPANVPIFQFKLVIPAAGILLFVQGMAQVARCIVAIRDDRWPELPAGFGETGTGVLHHGDDRDDDRRVIEQPRERAGT